MGKSQAVIVILRKTGARSQKNLLDPDCPFANGCDDDSASDRYGNTSLPGSAPGAVCQLPQASDRIR